MLVCGGPSGEEKELRCGRMGLRGLTGPPDGCGVGVWPSQHPGGHGRRAKRAEQSPD